MQPVAGDSSAYSAPTLRLRNPTSPASWFTLLGALLLGGMFWLTIAAARRTARAEERGDQLAALLLQEALAIAPIDWASATQREHLFARLLAAATARGVFHADLECDRDAAPTEFRVHNKHYRIVLRPSPRHSSGATTPIAADDDPLEAMAWPLSSLGPAHVVFFHPADAESAFSRNLQYAYADDTAEQPVPGRAHRRSEPVRRLWDYRGWDDERWLLHDRPPLDERLEGARKTSNLAAAGGGR